MFFFFDLTNPRTKDCAWTAVLLMLVVTSQAFTSFAPFDRVANCVMHHMSTTLHESPEIFT